MIKEEQNERNNGKRKWLHENLSKTNSKNGVTCKKTERKSRKISYAVEMQKGNKQRNKLYSNNYYKLGTVYRDEYRRLEGKTYSRGRSLVPLEPLGWSRIAELGRV
jgi:hypothetical protein